MPKTKEKFNKPEWQKDYMAKRRAKDPSYGNPARRRVTIAYCRVCKEERQWADALEHEDGILYCHRCGQPLWSLHEQPKAMKRREKHAD